MAAGKVGASQVLGTIVVTQNVYDEMRRSEAVSNFDFWLSKN